MKTHSYTVNLQWTGNLGSGTSTYSGYSRNHEISAPSKQTALQCSSDASFRGDRSRYNPEELLVSTLSACHMLWVLHLCTDRGIVVMEYTDTPSGEMIENEDGSGHFTRVVLRPKMRIAPGGRHAGALEAHRLAHHKCFIANSVNFEVTVEPEIAIVEAGPHP